MKQPRVIASMLLRLFLRAQGFFRTLRAKTFALLLWLLGRSQQPEPSARKSLGLWNEALPAWSDVSAAVKARDAQALWQEALLAMQSLDELLKKICFYSTHQELAVKRLMLANLAIHLDFLACLRASAGRSERLRVLRNLFNRRRSPSSMQTLETFHPVERIRSLLRLACSPVKEAESLLVFETRALSLVDHIPLETAAYLSLFSRFLYFFQALHAQVPVTRVQRLFGKIVHDVLRADAQEEPHPVFFNELTALALDAEQISARPRFS